MMEGKLSFETLAEIAREFDVSIDALLWRTVNLGVTKKEAVEEALKNPNFKALDRIHRVWTKPELVARKICASVLHRLPNG